MLIPNKILNIDDSLLYKALDYYYLNKSREMVPKTKDEIYYLTILYSLGFVNYTETDLGGKYEITIHKVKR